MVAATPRAPINDSTVVEPDEGSPLPARYGHAVFAPPFVAAARDPSAPHGLHAAGRHAAGLHAARIRARLRAVLVGCGALVLTACSAPNSLPGIGGGNDDVAFCRIAARLPTAAELVPVESVDDPATFDATLRAAVDTYLEDLDAMSARAPKRVEQQIKLLMSAVDQYKFADAIDARVAVDEYIATTCAGITTTTT